MQILPAVDILGGNCVQLVGGDKSTATVYGKPLENALRWIEQGADALHVVNLDGAFSASAENVSCIREVISETDVFVEVGGGIRSLEDARGWLDLGVDRIIISTFAVREPKAVSVLAEEFGSDKICAGVDARGSSVSVEGWTADAGDYISWSKRFEELGAGSLLYTYGVDVIDLTVLTRNAYEEIGFAEACYYHAVINGKYDTDGTTVIPDFATVDKTHLNIYGAKFVAYLFASEMSELDGIGGYVLPNIVAPTKADLIANPNYEVSDYSAPNLGSYNPPAHFTTITDGWYGTAFGNTGGSPQSTSNGYIAKEVSEGVFQVGQHLDSGSNKGKFQSADDGFAFVFRQVEANKNFKLTVTGEIVYTAGVKQAGFGLMLRDDCVIGQSATGSINTNYVTAGIYFPSDNVMTANFYRENATLNKGQSVSGSLTGVDAFTMTIERIGQVVNVTVVYGGQTYTATHTDFDFFAVDTQYMYVGMFANRGTVIECTNVVFEITGESQGA